VVLSVAADSALAATVALYDGLVRIHHRTRRLPGVRRPASGGQTRAPAPRRHACRLEYLYRFLSARAPCRVSVRACPGTLHPAGPSGHPSRADARRRRCAADDDRRQRDAVDRASGRLALLAAADPRRRSLLRAVGDRAAGAAVAVVYDASARVRSV